MNDAEEIFPHRPKEEKCGKKMKKKVPYDSITDKVFHRKNKY